MLDQTIIQNKDKINFIHQNKVFRELFHKGPLRSLQFWINRGQRLTKYGYCFGKIKSASLRLFFPVNQSFFT